ncbi:MAG TPA: IgGFc-binding protein [Nannocystaceae bacterium]|nr:IgGFc-binding protein [Nannocystaceae bacterium]
MLARSTLVLAVAPLFASGCADSSCRDARCSGNGEGGITATVDDGTSAGPTDGGQGTVADATSQTTSGADEEGTGPKFDFGELPPPPDLGGNEGPIIPTTCAEADAGQSTVGCTFYGVDMDSHDFVETSQYAIAVANVQLAGDASVTVENKQGGAWQVIAGPQVVPALGLYTFSLPDRHTDDTQLFAGGAYRVVSDVPIAAYQFNPVDGASSLISDASMLYPVPALDTLNHVTAWTSMQDNSGTFQHSYTTIVATSDGTQVGITPSVATAAGGSVPAGVAGTEFVVDMDDGDVLSIANAALGTSITGTRIESNDAHPVAVFAGQECALIPENVCCCDHLEEQLAGVRLWGTEFIASRMPVRNVAAPESTLWQIYASEDGTNVTIEADPGVTGIVDTQFVLQQGQVSQMYVSGPPGEEGDFRIVADKPINVLGYMVGSENLPAALNTTGDPAAIQLSPIEQYLPRYVVLVPGTWINDYAVITRPNGAAITIDGVPVPDADFEPVGASGFEVARVSVLDGVHVLDGGDAPFQVIIVGYDQWDSYAYLGGTGTGTINPDPEG